MATVALLDCLRDHPILGFVDWIFRGIGQVVFQNNPSSGGRTYPRCFSAR
jgi:hypothetical protein